MVASVALPQLLNGLDLPPETEHQAQEDLANQAAREAGVKAVEKTLHDLVRADPKGDPKIYTDVASRLMEGLVHSSTGGLEKDVDAALLRQQLAIEKTMRLAGLKAAREELYRLARRRAISDEVCRDCVRRIDLQEGRSQ